MTHKFLHGLRGELRRGLKSLVPVLLIMLSALFTVPNAQAAAPQIIIRDAEIENNIATWTKGVINAEKELEQWAENHFGPGSDVYRLVAESQYFHQYRPI